MNINDAFKKKIKYLRLPQWNDKAHIEITILENGFLGPWVKLYDPHVTDEVIELSVFEVNHMNNFEEFIR